MDSNKFIMELKECLIEGGIDSREINDTIVYYEEYFKDKIRKGCKEEEILSELGEPRLIAKTIIQTSGGSKNKKINNNANDSSYSSSYSYSYTGDDNNSYTSDKAGAKSKTKVFTIKNRFISALVIIGIVLFTIAIFIISLKILYVLLPFLLIYGLVRYLLK